MQEEFEQGGMEQADSDTAVQAQADVVTLENADGEHNGEAEIGGDVESLGDKESESESEREEGEGGDADGGEFEYSFDGVPPETQEEEEARDASVINTLRQKNKELEKRLQEIERTQTQLQPHDDGIEDPMPDLARDCGGDVEFFQQEMADWAARNAAAEVRKREALLAQEKELSAFREKIIAYDKRRKSMTAPDFESAETAVGEALSIPQVTAILETVDDPAPLIYALGKAPKVLADLSKKRDMVQFAVHLGRLSAQLRRTPKRPTTLPEKSVLGSARMKGGRDPELDRLRKDADRTGDDTALISYRAKQKRTTQ